MDVLEQLAASRNLPPGHYGKKEAEARVRAEYENCHKITKPYNRIWISLAAGQKLANRLCLEMGILKFPILKIEIDHIRQSGGFQRGKELCFPYEPISLGTLLHELAHYVCWRERIPKSYNHGTGFVEYLKFVCSVYEQLDKPRS